MGRTVSIGAQGFDDIRQKNCFYVDKTDFIRQWWESDDKVTLITRPRRFGKTLNINMLECFFSVKYAGRTDLFEGLDIWKYEKYREMQGTYPVIFMSFADIKSPNYDEAAIRIKQNISALYNRCQFLKESKLLSQNEKEQFDLVRPEMSDAMAVTAVRQLAEYFSRYYGKNTIILMDEYDPPCRRPGLPGIGTKSYPSCVISLMPHLRQTLTLSVLS